jgi:curved DNA-binding protein CbpA
MLRCNPDRVVDPTLKAVKQEEFHKVQQAFELLADRDRRSRYDYEVQLSQQRKETSRGVTIPRTGPVGDGIRTREAHERPDRYIPSSDRNASRKIPKPFRSTDVEGQRSEMDQNRPGEKESAIEKENKRRNEKADENLRAGVAGAHGIKGDDPGKGYSKSWPGEDSSSEKLPTKIRVSPVPPSDLGLKILNLEIKNASVDIGAVHGLGALPKITWKDSKSVVNGHSNTEMLPSLVPEARIMRFGYDSMWLVEERIRTSLSGIAERLLLALNREREVYQFSIH